MIARTPAGNFPRRNFCFAWPIRSIFSCDMMQIVQARCGHARWPVGKIQRDWLGLNPYPAIAVTAISAELGVAKKQSPSFAQGKAIRISDHGVGQSTRRSAN